MTKLIPENSKVAGFVKETSKGLFEYEVQEMRQFTEDGELVEFYDGSPVWFRVLEKVNGMTNEVFIFGEDSERAFAFASRKAR